MSTYWGEVDTSYLQRTAAVLQRSRLRSYDLMRVQPGAKVADIGCAFGTDTIPLGEIVGPAGQVVGIDYNRAFVAAANARAAEAGMSAWVTHQFGDATDLPLATDTFDACHSERVFLHLAQPEQALGEMVRITRPGGWVVIVDTDFATLSIDVPDFALERKLIRFNSETLRNGTSGRKLYRMFRRQALTEIEVEPMPLYFTKLVQADEVFKIIALADHAVEQGAITAAEARQWRDSLAQAAAEDVFFMAGLAILIAGRKP